jgi:hypothetical protein
LPETTGPAPRSSSHSIFFAKVAELLREHMPEASFTVVNTGGIGDNHALLIRDQSDSIGARQRAASTRRSLIVQSAAALDDVGQPALPERQTRR